MNSLGASFGTGFGCKFGFELGTLAGTLVRLGMLPLALWAAIRASAQLTLHCLTLLQHHARASADTNFHIEIACVAPLLEDNSVALCNACVAVLHNSACTNCGHTCFCSGKVMGKGIVTSMSCCVVLKLICASTASRMVHYSLHECKTATCTQWRLSFCLTVDHFWQI